MPSPGQMLDQPNDSNLSLRAQNLNLWLSRASSEEGVAAAPKRKEGREIVLGEEQQGLSMSRPAVLENASTGEMTLPAAEVADPRASSC